MCEFLLDRSKFICPIKLALKSYLRTSYYKCLILQKKVLFVLDIFVSLYLFWIQYILYYNLRIYRFMLNKYAFQILIYISALANNHVLIIAFSHIRPFILMQANASATGNFLPSTTTITLNGNSISTYICHCLKGIHFIAIESNAILNMLL